MNTSKQIKIGAILSYTSIAINISKTTDKQKQDKEYFEKIAREEYGYCKPGEKVYYNSSFGE